MTQKCNWIILKLLGPWIMDNIPLICFKYVSLVMNDFNYVYWNRYDVSIIVINTLTIHIWVAVIFIKLWALLFYWYSDFFSLYWIVCLEELVHILYLNWSYTITGLFFKRANTKLGNVWVVTLRKYNEYIILHAEPLLRL
jgi:hypothetical protein